MFDEEPEMYRVIMLNDEYTYPEFIVAILGDVFDMRIKDANNLISEIKAKGEGVAGSYPWDIAMSKAKEVQEISDLHGFPLRCVVLNKYNTVG
jgi:ATP-dependent Clp protease adaptor protein ClpS